VFIFLIIPVMDVLLLPFISRTMIRSKRPHRSNIYFWAVSHHPVKTGYFGIQKKSWKKGRSIGGVMNLICISA
jgi:hypothetical protein